MSEQISNYLILVPPSQLPALNARICYSGASTLLYRFTCSSGIGRVFFQCSQESLNYYLSLKQVFPYEYYVYTFCLQLAPTYTFRNKHFYLVLHMYDKGRLKILLYHRSSIDAKIADLNFFILNFVKHKISTSPMNSFLLPTHIQLYFHTTTSAITDV